MYCGQRVVYSGQRGQQEVHNDQESKEGQVHRAAAKGCLTSHHALPHPALRCANALQAHIRGHL